MEPDPEPVERQDFNAATLMAQHPPVWRDPNKRVVFDIACRPGDAYGAKLGYSRWAAMRVPETIGPYPTQEFVIGRDGYFDYVPLVNAGAAIEWHVNFADPHLFVAYGSALFAQDEMQVAEHPALGALREALVADGETALTVEHGRPTPVLVTGVERRCHIATDPNEAAGRPYGLYGNAFARAPSAAVVQATARIDPPTITNLIAIAAPRGGYSRYRLDEIELVLVTAFTGFRAAVSESIRLRETGVSVVAHTGYWGCGAFGGNRVLMALLQVMAAHLAGLDRLVFHTGPPGGDEPLDAALKLIREELLLGRAMTTRDVISTVESMAFEWGVGDGN